MYFECPHFIKLLGGAGSACPNAPTDISVDVFGRADPAPTGWHFAYAILTSPRPIREKNLSPAGSFHSPAVMYHWTASLPFFNS